MKNLILAAILTLICVGCVEKKVVQEDKNIVLAYVTSKDNVPLPDPNVMTHINYAFGVMNDSCDGVVIKNPTKLHKIVALKSVNPELKVLLSIGGWTAGGFSEMAIDVKKRAKFVEHCVEITKEFQLDGIDMDWEYPTSSESGIHSDPSDTENFTSLIKELRAALGEDKLVTFASIASAQFVDFKAVEPYLDFVNLMVYDIGRPQQGLHHTALYDTERTRLSVDSSVKLHREAGLPNNKIVVGLAFYGHGNTELGYNDFIHFPQVAIDCKDDILLWDDAAKVPYYVSSEDSTLMLCIFDNAYSLELKCDYAKDNELGGVMYWEYNYDDEQRTLSNAVWNRMQK